MRTTCCTQALWALVLVTCVGASAAVAAELSLGAPAWTVKGLVKPESVAIASDGQYVVSNINGEPTAKDGNGFLTAIDPVSRSSARLYPLAGAAPLHAPKGVCAVGEAIAATDIDRIVIVEKGRARFIPQSYGVLATPTFLNDIAYDGKQWLYASDTRLGRVLRFSLDGERVEQVATGLAGVNGLLWRGGKLIVGTSSAHDLAEIDVRARAGPKWFGLGQHFTMIDGIVALDDGTLIVTDARAGIIYAVSPDRKKVTTLKTDLPFPADCTVDRNRALLLVPMLQGDAVVAFPLQRK